MRGSVETSFSLIRDIFSSKDAYMLIYARKPESSTVDALNLTNNSSASTPLTVVNGSGKEMTSVTTPTSVPVPPQRAQDVVRTLNTAHDEACRQFLSR